MENIGSKSQAHGKDNEDFCFTYPLSSAQLLIVGDFAESDYVGIDAATTTELTQLLADPSIIAAADSSVPLLLAQLATNLNVRLLDFRDASKTSFQCSVMFAATAGALLYYLPVGDCRISIRRGNSLILLNGSLWTDSVGHPLPTFINSSQEMKRGPEPPPDQALGNSSQISFSPSHVQQFPLERDDLVMLYSDGVDKVVSPAGILALVEEHAGKESTQNLVELILNDFRLRGGNDDRTLVIAPGPYLASENAAIAHADGIKQEVETNLGQMATRVSEIENKIEQISNLPGLVTGLEKSVAVIAKNVAELPNRADLAAGLVSARNIEPDTFNTIRESLAGLRSEVNSIKKSLVDPQGQQSGKQKRTRASTDPTVNSASAANLSATPPPNHAPEQPLINELNTDLPFREGLIHIGEGLYELVDESYCREDENDPKKEIYLAPTPAAPPGWLTAFYLALRLQKDQPSSDMQAPSIRIWIRNQISETAKVLAGAPDTNLPTLRMEHCRLRDTRTKFRISSSKREILVEAEVQLARDFFRTTGESTRPKPIAIQNKSSNHFKEKLVSFSRDPLGVVVILGIVAIIIMAFMLLYSFFDSGRAIDRPEVSPSPSSEKVKLEYGADGRALFAASRGKTQPLNYRIEIGKEKYFKELFSDSTFESTAQLESMIASKASTLVRPLADPIVVSEDKGEGVKSVQPSDVQGASGNEKCARFLKRVNDLLPPNVHTSIEQLNQLNPGLRCGDLKADDQLVVYIKPILVAPNQPGGRRGRR